MSEKGNTVSVKKPDKSRFQTTRLVQISDIQMVPSVQNLDAKLDRFNINNFLIMLKNGKTV